MADLIYRKELRDALYEADAVTMQGVKIINQFPAVNAVEVVHCEKCRKRHTWECAMHYESEDGKEQYGWESDNDFCSWGERKDGDGNG